MKVITLNKIVLLIITLLILFSCRKEKGSSPEEGHLAEYFRCKINGEDFHPRGNFNCSRYTFSYSPQGGLGIDQGYFLLAGKDCPTMKSVALRINGLSEPVSYLDFIEPVEADSCFPFYRHNLGNGTILLFESLQSGSLNISTFTPYNSETNEPGKIEGTFEFTVSNENNDSTINITDGAFAFEVYAEW